jgi:hypothetical protein
LKKSVDIDGNLVLLDANKRLAIPINKEAELVKYLMSPEELLDHFLTVFESHIELKSLSKVNALKVCKHFQEFILAAMKKFKETLPFDDPVLMHISALDPNLSSNEDWVSLAKRFPNIIPSGTFEKFFDEASNWMTDIEKLKKMRADHVKLVKIKQAESDEPIQVNRFDAVSFFMNDNLKEKYPQITKLARAVLTLPHSGANVEKAFSQLKLIKDEKRNRLGNDTLQSLMMAKINRYDLENSEILHKVYEYNQGKSLTRKRKHSQIASSEAEMSEGGNSNIIEDKSVNATLDSKIDLELKKLKLTSVSKSEIAEEMKEDHHQNNDIFKFDFSQQIIATIGKYTRVFEFNCNI